MKNSTTIKFSKNKEDFISKEKIFICSSCISKQPIKIRYSSNNFISYDVAMRCTWLNIKKT